MNRIDEFERQVCIAACNEEKAEKNLTWNEVRDYLNARFNHNYSEGYYRKNYAYPIKDKELYKETVTPRDRNNEERAKLRREAREETIREIAHEAVEKLKKCEFIPTVIETSNKEGILLLSDWHYGINVDSYFNKYNTDIALKRIDKLLSTTLDYIKKNNIKTVHVVNLGDLICGRIHMQLRLQSQTDVITQTIEVAEVLAAFLKTLMVEGKVRVEYYDTLDNHSRLEPLKENSLDLESLVRIITWYLKEKFSLSKNIHFNNNVYADDIVSFNVLGHDVIAVHGHKDPPTKAIEQLSMLTQKHYDLVLTSHYHHFNADEQNETVRISNGSLMGTDNYAQDLRLNSKPSQTFIVATKENVCEAIHKINL